jgi:hypothetical protein
MKAKTFSKKLIIKKATIVNLSKEAQKEVEGGAIKTFPLTYCPFTACGDSIVIACVC